jgi:hypothetical protein
MTLRPRDSAGFAAKLLVTTWLGQGGSERLGSHANGKGSEEKFLASIVSVCTGDIQRLFRGIEVT